MLKVSNSILGETWVYKNCNILGYKKNQIKLVNFCMCLDEQTKYTFKTSGGFANEALLRQTAFKSSNDWDESFDSECYSFELYPWMDLHI